ncbi:hypothetical protein [Novosphingobium sp.]|uniref:hypothetical protein n=1 Tax=Novosphingobium sp. TaxID=1874826 RepID=UPI0035B16389
MADSRLPLVEAALEHAAEVLGDVTPLVMAEFFTRYPEAEASFAHHAPHNPAKLEAEMVENALYCLMTWCERRAEVEIILQTSAPHHNDTLQVPYAWYSSMIAATGAVLARASRDEGERSLWQDLCAELEAAVASAA